MAKSKPICEVCGGTIHGSHCFLCELFETHAVPGGHATTTWPQESRALAVHPNQIKDQAEYAKRRGVPTRYTKEGRPIFTSRGHRAEYMGKVEGKYVDYDGGYSDNTNMRDVR